MKSATPLRSRLFWIYVVVFLDLFAVGIIIPTISMKYRELSVNPIDQGIISSCYSLTQFIFNPIIGQMSDSYGRRKVLYMSLVGSMVSYLMLGYATSVEMMILSRLLIGVIKQTITVVRAYISDMCSPSEINDAYIDSSIIVGLAFIIGPIFGSMIAFAGTHFAGLVSAAIFLVDIILIFFFFPPDKARAIEIVKENVSTPKATMVGEVHSFFSNFMKVWRTPDAFQHLLLRFIQSFVTSMQRSTFSPIVEIFGFPPTIMGYVLAYFGTIGVVSSFILKRLANQLKDPNTVYYSYVFTAVSALIMSHAHNFYFFMFLAPINQFFLTIISTVTATVYSGLFEENKGVALGIIGSAESIGGILGPLIGGYLFSAGGIYVTYLGCAIFSVFPLVLHYLPGFRK